jgi:hypothetical protein
MCNVFAPIFCLVEEMELYVTDNKIKALTHDVNIIQ